MTKQTKAYLALAFICIVWGTTYLALRVAVQHYPAFLYAAIRQVISGGIIITIGLMMSRQVDLSRRNLMVQAVVGFLLITVGNGLVTWGEIHVPSGVAALICSMMPIAAVVVNLAGPSREKLTAPIVIGMLLGVCGVALIFKDNIDDLFNRSYLLGMIGIFVATCSWAFGSVYSKKRQSKVNPVFNAGLQLLFGGVFLFAGSPLIDDYSVMDFWHPEAIWPMVYLIVAGSVLAYTAYMFALRELPVGVVSLYAYVNPLVAVLLGYWLLNEQLTWFTALAFITIMAGVFLVNYGYRRQQRRQQAAVAKTTLAYETQIADV